MSDADFETGETTAIPPRRGGPLKRLVRFVIPRRVAHAARAMMPRRLFARSLLIVVLPMLLLQAVAAGVFMERHFQLVTRRLSEATTRSIAALVSVHEALPDHSGDRLAERIAAQDLDLQVAFLPPGPLPAPRPKPFFDILDQTLSRQIARQIGKPFWIDTVGRSEFVEIRIQLGDAILKVTARRSQTYAANWHIFLVWMGVASVAMMAIAILFLRNQIRPIQRLAEAAEEFGKGRRVEGFRPHGATEVRQAARAFIEMRRRIERQIEQRTFLLAGVSHDLRTMLTRFRLELAFLPEGPEVEALRADVDTMQEMLEAYLAFARGDQDEDARPLDLGSLIEDVSAHAEALGAVTHTRFEGTPMAIVKPTAFRRALANLVVNAARHGHTVDIAGRHLDGWVTVTVDDDGPGIPEAERELVFRPFYRGDGARNQDRAGTGLGLTIARDVVRAHGGDLTLETSPLGGLRARMRLPG
ncbi:ATP-binding protein [Segnochrobactraceae bacterium EtOH-i3]